MWFGILGALLVHDGTAVISVSAARQRVLLAALLTQAGKTISADALAELVWDGAPPNGAAVTLRSHVMRLRGVLGPTAGSRLVTHHPGYLIEAAEQELDLLRFTSLCREGGAALRAGAWHQASDMLGEALRLWRGEPLGDVKSEALTAREVPRLTEMRLQALEARIDADLHLGRHAEVIAELKQLTAAYRLRERLHALLMLALYRDDRQADALAVYQRARATLIEELGAEPGSRLRELHQQVLAADPALKLPEPSRLGVIEILNAVPLELPATTVNFTGRTKELAALSALVDHYGGQAPGAIVVSAIGGAAGVGKTALAVHWAHQAAGRFPDGQLYVDLRGYDPAQPMSAADALAGFLRALGVPGKDVPPEEDERAARYRSLLAGRRMLVLLDNAGSAEQVRPLLPGTPGCVVIVTSRDSLAGLVARHGAIHLDLDLLPEADAVSLLQALIGERADAQPDAVRALAGHCCRLPLALRVAAELAAARPADPLAHMASELADQQQRLELLDAGGDPRTAVRAVFSWSYRHLDAAAAQAFRLAGLHPGRDFDGYALAALAGTGLEHARRMLAILVRAHLLRQAGPGRYGMHDLLRAYARELAANDGEDARHAALTRLLEHYLHTAATAIDAVLPAEARRRPHVPRSASPAPPVAEPAVARTWLDAEQANLVAVAEHAAANGWPGHATRLSATLGRYLENGGHFAQAHAIHTHARAAARRAGDHAAEADALNSLGLVAWWRGQYEQAAGLLRQALALHRETGDQNGQAYVLANLGIVVGQQCQYQQAAGYLRQALALHRETGDRTGEARALSNLGMVEQEQGRYARAASLYQESLILSRENGDKNSEAYGLVNLGEVEKLLGHCDQATAHFRRGLNLFREVGNRSAQSGPLARMGEVEMRQGHHEVAVDYYRQSLVLSRELGDPANEAAARNGLGDAFLAAGRPEDSRHEYTAVLSLAVRIGRKYELARAHDGLAGSYLATGDYSQARPHWQQALDLYTSLGAPEAEQVQARLARLARVAGR
jgi:DNA-binding SARP family transcriptional activator/tetratricopeptide (TPR) repeat protein